MNRTYKCMTFLLFFFFINNDSSADYPTPKSLLRAILDVNKNCFITKKSIERSIATIPVDDKGYFKPDTDYIQKWLDEHSTKYNFKIPYKCPICYENKANLFKLQKCCHAFCRLCLVQQYVRKNYTEYTHAKCSICRTFFGIKVRKALKKHKQYKKLYALHETTRLQEEEELIEQQIEQDWLLAEFIEQQIEPNWFSQNEEDLLREDALHRDYRDFLED